MKREIESIFIHFAKKMYRIINDMRSHQLKILFIQIVTVDA